MCTPHRLHTALIAVAISAFLTSCDGDRAPAAPATQGSTVGSETPTTATPNAASGPTAVSLTEWDGNVADINLDHCGLDTVNAMPAVDGVLAVSATDPITIEGWAATPDLDTPSSVTLFVKGAKNGLTVAPTGIPREDVAVALKSPKLANAGFRAAIPPGALPTGDYTLYVGVAHNNMPLVCDGKSILRIN